MIEVKNLHKSAKLKKLLARKKTILSNISFSVPQGKIVSIIGQNGAGKSTVIKTILGFTSPDTGSVNLEPGVTLGYLPENPYYYDYLTLRELLWFSASSFGMSRSDFKAAAESTAKTVGMQDHLGQRLRTFSKGMTQRAGIAAAIVHDPDLVIFDEPMSGLDPVGRKMVFDLLIGLRRRGKTILFCSHILSDVERLCDEVLIMHQGQIRRQLTQSDLTMAGKTAEIIVSFTPEVVECLQSENIAFVRNDDYISLSSDQRQLNQHVDLLRSHGIDIVSVRSAAVSLENIFYDVIKEQESSCAL